MANQVYANNMEVSCKSASGKSIAAFPDVCFTPPQAPPTPMGVPIPYPNTGMSSDTTNGTRTIKITGKEVMLKDKSYFKTSYGDEAGCAPKKGVITSKIKGKVYFIAWSMNVKFEGENVVRHLDMTTHNHASPNGNTPPMAHVSKMSAAVQKACKEEIDKGKKACKGQTSDNCGQACKDAQRCLLVPKGQDKAICCKPDTTGHHMVEDHWVTGNSNFPTAQGSSGYNAAPCVCANRFRSRGTVHRGMHDIQGTFEESHMAGGSRFKAAEPNGGWNYTAGKNACLDAHAEVFKGSGCKRSCLEAQLDDFYGKDGKRPLNEPHTQAIGEDVRPTLAEKYAPPKKKRKTS